MEPGERPGKALPLRLAAVRAYEEPFSLTDLSFSELGVAEPLCRALQAEAYLNPTPIQAQAIPPLLEGRDLLGIAQTGTGKTAAFALPILQQLDKQREERRHRATRALILAPTRELAIQLGDALGTYGRHLGLRKAVIFGGVGQQPQVRALGRGLDIVVATPGRLLDLMRQGHLKLHQVSTLVLDEADRMLDMGFIRDVRRIVAALPKQRQTLLFSATMPPDVAKLAAEILHRPLRVEVTPKAVAVERIEQQVHFVEAKSKRALLIELLADGQNVVLGGEGNGGVIWPEISFVRDSIVAMGLTLAAVGLFGVISYVVSRRRREIGTRLAVGAAPTDVVRSVVRDTMKLAVRGLLVGIPLAVLTWNAGRSAFVGIEPGSPASYAAALVAVLLVAALASWLPARRAASIDPAEALRVE